MFDFVRDTLLLRAPDGAPETERRARLALRHALPADDGAGHREGGRGHGLLPRTPAWCRSTRWAATRGASASRRPPSTRRTRSGSGDGRRRLLATSTHDTKRGEDVRARINVLSEVPRRVAGGGPPLASADAPAAAPGGRARRPRPERRVPPVPDLGRRLAARRGGAGEWRLCRPHGRVHGEGDPGGQGAHGLDRPRCGVRRRRAGVRVGRAGAGFGDRGGDRAVRAPRRAPRHGQLARSDRAQDRRPRRPRLLPGGRAVGPVSRRPGQSAAGGLGRPPADARGAPRARRGAGRGPGRPVRRAARGVDRRPDQALRDPPGPRAAPDRPRPLHGRRLSGARRDRPPRRARGRPWPGWPTAAPSSRS